MHLLSRDDFRAQVLARDQRCVVCGNVGPLDAHHIMERRLWPDGGYYVENGAAVCQARCHLLAEQTVLSCEELRAAAGITRTVLPPHLYRDQRYDKWGNPILEDGRRLRGELFDDDSVKKVLAQGGKLGLFSHLVKYPRTWHLPWSPGATDDDRVLQDDSIFFHAPVVVTLKMDGENTTWYQDYMHARSIDYAPHPSRDRVKALWAERCFEIPEGWRVCGENVYAKHSIGYDNLPGYFLVFSVWNERNECLSWTDTVDWAALLTLPTVPVLYAGLYNRKQIEDAFAPHAALHEGYVIRLAGTFHYREFSRSLAKYVRASHVQTHGHWMRQRVVPNTLKGVGDG